MKSFYEGNSTKSGVYKIVNIANKRIYIGSTKRFKERKNNHVYSLNRGTHHNKFLQNDFIKCGIDSFEFHIIEVVEGEQSNRFLAEQKYVDEYFDNQELCYNFMSKTNTESRLCYSRNPEETRRKKLEKLRSIWDSKEYKELKRQQSKDIWKNEEVARSRSEKMKAKWAEPGYREKMKQHTDSLGTRLKEKAHSKEARAKRSIAMQGKSMEHLKEFNFPKGNIPWNKDN